MRRYALYQVPVLVIIASAVEWFIKCCPQDILADSVVSLRRGFAFSSVKIAQ